MVDAARPEKEQGLGKGMVEKVEYAYCSSQLSRLQRHIAPLSDGNASSPPNPSIM
jgi:hypothetical protein